MREYVNKTHAERIATLEAQVGILLAEQEKANKKLDDLLSLRNKGVGFFWLVSGLLGIGFSAVINLGMDWIKGH